LSAEAVQQSFIKDTHNILALAFILIFASVDLKYWWAISQNIRILHNLTYLQKFSPIYST
jgi:hypothetical protein